MQRKWKLTHTEARVAMLLGERKTNREIASDLDVTEHTARRHTEHVLKKLKVHNRAHVQRVLLSASDSPPTAGGDVAVRMRDASAAVSLRYRYNDSSFTDAGENSSELRRPSME